MILEGKFQAVAPVERVWRFLLDVPGVAGCLPGCEGVEAVAEGKHLAVITAKVGPIRARISVTAVMGEVQPHKYLSIAGVGKDAYTASPVRGRLELTLVSLSPQETEISYKADVFVGGRLGQFGDGIVRETANVIIQDFVPNLRARLESQDGPAPRPREINLLKLLPKLLVGMIRGRLRRWWGKPVLCWPWGRAIGELHQRRGVYGGF